jgi:HEAT repeat protein
MMKPVLRNLCLGLSILAAASGTAGRSETSTLPEDPGVAVDRLLALAGKGQEAVSGFRAGLEHPHEDVRTTAAQLLYSELKAGARDDLAGMTGDKSANVVVAAVHGLVRIGGPEVRAPLRKALEHEDPDVRGQTCAYIGDYQVAGMTADLGKMISDPEAQVRASAVSAIQAIGSPDGFTHLAAATGDANGEIAIGAIRGLLSLGDKRALPRLTRLAASENAHVRQEASYAVAAMDGGASQSELLGKLLEDKNPSVRQSVIRGFADHPDAASLPLLTAAAKDGDEGVRRRVVTALKVSPAEGADDVLAPFVEDDSDKVRAASINAMAERDPQGHKKRIHGAAGDSSPVVRSVVATALGTIGDADGLDLLDKLVRDKEPGVRGTAARATGKVGTARALTILDVALKDSDDMVRMMAVEGLGDVQEDGALERLRKAVSDSSTPVRVSAIRLLGKRGDTEAIPLLKEAAREPAEMIRQAARAALREIQAGQRAGS